MAGSRAISSSTPLRPPAGPPANARVHEFPLLLSLYLCRGLDFLSASAFARAAEFVCALSDTTRPAFVSMYPRLAPHPLSFTAHRYLVCCCSPTSTSTHDPYYTPYSPRISTPPYTMPCPPTRHALQVPPLPILPPHAPLPLVLPCAFFRLFAGLCTISSSLSPLSSPSLLSLLLFGVAPRRIPSHSVLPPTPPTIPARLP